MGPVTKTSPTALILNPRVYELGSKQLFLVFSQVPPPIIFKVLKELPREPNTPYLRNMA